MPLLANFQDFRYILAPLFLLLLLSSKIFVKRYIKWLLNHLHIEMGFSVQMATKLTYRRVGNTTLSFSNMIGPLEEIQFLGLPITHIIPTVTGQPQVSIALYGMVYILKGVAWYCIVYYCIVWCCICSRSTDVYMLRSCMYSGIVTFKHVYT